MPKDRFELNPTKPNSVRALTLEGTPELDTADNKSARAGLLDVLNSFISDIMIGTQSRTMDTMPEPVRTPATCTGHKKEKTVYPPDLAGRSHVRAYRWQRWAFSFL